MTSAQKPESAQKWECPACGWFQQAHPRYGWAAHDDRAVDVHQSHLCPRVPVWERAAQRLDREVEAEELRLIAAGQADPWRNPMLANWLGGLRAAAQVLRDEAPPFRPGAGDAQ